MVTDVPMTRISSIEDDEETASRIGIDHLVLVGMERKFEGWIPYKQKHTHEELAQFLIKEHNFPNPREEERELALV